MKMIGVKEAAKAIGVSASRVRKLCRDKRIRPVPKHIGRDWVIAAHFEVIEAGRIRPGKIVLTQREEHYMVIQGPRSGPAGMEG